VLALITALTQQASC